MLQIPVPTALIFPFLSTAATDFDLGIDEDPVVEAI
jgi:hypothetical protein